MSRLANDRLLRPRDMVDSDLGVGLVYPLDERFQRLDLWLADHAGGVVRGHAALPPAAGRRGGRVRAREPGRAPRADAARRLGPPPADGDAAGRWSGDWQSAGTVAGPALTGLSGSGVTGLMGAVRWRQPGGRRRAR